MHMAAATATVFAPPGWAIVVNGRLAGDTARVVEGDEIEAMPEDAAPFFVVGAALRNLLLWWAS